MAGSELYVEMARQIKQLIQEALTNRVFPGGVLLASRQGEVLVREAFGTMDFTLETPVSQDTVYDLASLTKPLATTLAVMHLVGTARLSLDQTLGDLLPACAGTEKAGITVAHLLAHRSGLPDYRPYWRALSGKTALARDADLKARLIREPLVNPVGHSTMYSDPGFMFLRWLVEEISGAGMNRVLEKEVYAPLGIADLLFPNDRELAAGSVAPTEMCAWRKRLIKGVVHDENAYAVGGVDGHAGLFGSVAGIHGLLWEISCAYAGRPNSGVLLPDLVKTFLNYGKADERALGFDRPTQPGSSSGKYFSENSVGHLGFTGTSFWMDLERAVIVILLTNRIHPTRENDKIRIFRPVIHDAVMESIL